MKYSNFKVIYTLTSPSLNWKGEIGRINEKMIEKYMPEPNNDSLILVCGPSSFMNSICGNKIKLFQGPLKGILKV